MARCGTCGRERGPGHPATAEELSPGKRVLFTVERYKPGGYDDIISSADKPEMSIAVHHASVSSDKEIPSNRGGSFLWIVLGTREDVGDRFVWSEEEKGVWRP